MCVSQVLHCPHLALCVCVVSVRTSRCLNIPVVSTPTLSFTPEEGCMSTTYELDWLRPLAEGLGRQGSAAWG